MTLAPDDTLLHYRIVERIGAGGMGEVWKAVDTNLDREVAIKILPEALAQDAGRLERFSREAKLLASLNHPNIASVYSVHEDKGVPFLAMELVPGEDLAQLLRRGPLKPRKVLQVASGMAEGLAAAHERGIVHRDVKPGNVLLVPDGTVKMLDFGLAKSVGGPLVDDSAPTMGKDDTAEGTILGTTRYMSPEQARGEPVDRRTDVWSFGCVLFELLTGTPAHTGRTVSDTIANILTKEPEWRRLPTEVSPSVRTLLGRCLRKDPARRPRDMSDIRLEISDALEGGSEVPGAAPARGRKGHLAAWGGWVAAVVVLLGAALTAWWLDTAPPASPGPVRFTMKLPESERLWVSYTSTLAVSPDGQTLALVAENAGRRRILVRRLDELTLTPIPGTDNGDTPFFSPDGRSVGFAANGRYWRVALSGGDPIPIATAPKGTRGAAWLPEDTIVYTGDFGTGLQRVPVSGGAAQPLTELDPKRGDVAHGWPKLDADGKWLVFTTKTAHGSRPTMLNLEDGRHPVIEEVGDVDGARYLPSGHLVYAQSGRLMALPFDPDQMKPTGPPARVVDSVFTSPDRMPFFAVSDSGVLIYAAGGVAAPSRRHVWVTRNGDVSDVPGGHRDAFEEGRLSPDGTSFLALVHTPLAQHHIWSHDLRTGRRTLLVSEANSIYPIWMEDGASIAFASSLTNELEIYRRAADASGSPELWLSRPGSQRPNSWSPTHQLLASYEPSPLTGEDIYLLPADGGEAIPFSVGPGDQRVPRFSPDGRWIAYVSNETGIDEVYLAEYPPGRREIVSIGGGREPVWSRDGRKLFYRFANRMLEVDFEPSERGPSIGAPRVLFEGDFYQDADGHPNYDVAPDGRFLMIALDEGQRPTELHVVVNWLDELRRLAPPSND